MSEKPTYEELEQRIQELEQVESDRKRTEKALRESEEKYRQIFDNSTIGIGIADQEGRIIIFNDAILQPGNYSKDDIRKLDSIGELYYNPDDRNKVLSIARNQGFVNEMHIKFKRKDGTPYDTLLSLRPIAVEGKPCWQAIVSDITESKQAVEALRESEEKFRFLAENMGDIVWTVDLDFRTTYVSPSVENVLGFTPTERMHQSLEEMVTPESLQNIQEVFLKELESDGKNTVDPNRSFTIEIEYYHKNGSTVWMENIVKAIQAPDGILAGIHGVSRDITERKNAEEEKADLQSQLQHAQKMESIGTLAGGIAHEFNNILGIVLGNAELAMEKLSERNSTRHNLKEIRTASLRAKDVVRQLLSFARKSRLEKKPVNIISIVSESLKLLRSSIPASIEFRQNISEDIDIIMADPTQINQVLINLCTNAEHAMPEGGMIEVTLKNSELEEDTAAKFPELNPGRFVTMTVSDTGHGIYQDVIDRIFDPYFTTKEVGKGTGMGLAVVHGIVKEHNGLITAESEIGKGTTFSIFFPAIEKEAVLETEIDEELPHGSESILFIDDEDSLVELGYQKLKRLGYEVDATTSPIEALHRFRSDPNKFDLVITDMTMPQMTGDKLAIEILNIRPDIPIILCTGFSEKIDEKKAKEIGATDYIEKPIDELGFASKVRKVLDGK